MEGKKMRRMPAFGEWECYSHDLPIIQYLESAPSKPARRHRPGTPKVIIRAKKGDGKQQEAVKGSVRPMAVDEDLYKIPTELLYQKRKSKMRRVLTNLMSGCLSLNCIR